MKLAQIVILVLLSGCTQIGDTAYLSVEEIGGAVRFHSEEKRTGEFRFTYASDGSPAKNLLIRYEVKPEKVGSIRFLGMQLSRRSTIQLRTNDDGYVSIPVVWFTEDFAQLIGWEGKEWGPIGDLEVKIGNDWIPCNFPYFEDSKSVVSTEWIGWPDEE